MDTPKEDKPLYKGHYSRHQIIISLQCQYNLNLWEEDNLSTKDKVAGPKMSFIRRFHCIYLL